MQNPRKGLNLAIFPTGFFIDLQEPYCTDHFHVCYRNKNGEDTTITSQVTAEDLTTLANIVVNSGLKPGAEIVECGAFVGQTTCLLGLLAKSMGGRVTTIDNFKGNEGTLLENPDFDVRSLLERNLARYGVSDVVTIIEGDSRSITKECDFVFLDAGHTYTDVKMDIEHWWLCIRPGGILCGHDLDSNTYNDLYIHQDYVNGVHHGVVKAVFEQFKTRVRRYKNNSSMWYVEKQEST